jgi:hypothetical protein
MTAMPQIILRQAWETVHRAREQMRYASLVGGELAAELEGTEARGAAGALKNWSGRIMRDLDETLRVLNQIGELTGTTDPVYVDVRGRVLYGVHQRDEACDNGCPIHSPSDHPLREAPIAFDGSDVMRKCQHGKLHPDPDFIEYLREGYGDTVSSIAAEHNDCCGCCS